MTRRRFLRTTTATTAAVAFPTIIPAQVLASPDRPGPNDRIQVGLIGFGGRARAILKAEGLPGGELVAVADCFAPRLHESASLFPDGAKWTKYPSYRAMLDQETLDAVFVETTTFLLGDARTLSRGLVCP